MEPLTVRIDVTGVGDDDTLEIRMTLARIAELEKELRHNGVSILVRTDDVCPPRKV